MKILLSLALPLILAGCMSSGIVTGTARPRSNPAQMRIYDTDTMPSNFQVIGIVSCSDAMTSGGAVNALKRRAANMGANAVVLTGQSGDAWNGVSLQGKAIWVDEKPSQ
jgi:hypothetical protein